MPQLPDLELLPDDPALQGGEWLYRRRGEVFGPVDSRTLAALLYRGEIEGGTPVSTDGDRWLPVGEVSPFRLHARKAEAALRVAQEVTGARMLRQRKHRRKVYGVVALVLALVAGAATAPFLLWRSRGPVSPLLEDFGEGIKVASARVGVAAGARADEVEVAFDRSGDGGGAAPPRRGDKVARAASRPVQRPQGAAAGGELSVEARFDPGRIQATVNREQRTLVPCFREEAARSSDFHGQVPLEFAIGNDGRVVALWIDEPRFKEGPLRECLLRALGAWRFDPFPGQRPTVQLAFAIR